MNELKIGTNHLIFQVRHRRCFV